MIVGFLVESLSCFRRTVALSTVRWSFALQPDIELPQNSNDQQKYPQISSIFTNPEPEGLTQSLNFVSFQCFRSQISKKTLRDF
jgi:hypothetical protein